MIKLQYPESIPGGEKKDNGPVHIFMFILLGIFLMVLPFVLFSCPGDEHRDHGYVVDKEFVPATYGKNNHPDEYIIYVANKYKLFEVHTTKELFVQTSAGDSVSSVKKLETK